VLTIRCTRKLLERLDVEVSSVPLHPTNCLGDWYANLLFTGRARLIICISERILMPPENLIQDDARMGLW
jgi:hypothetical protein